MGYYDNNIQIVNGLIDKVEKSLRREKRKHTTKAKEFNELSGEIDELEEKIQSNQEELDNLFLELQQVQDVIEKIDRRLDDIPEYKGLMNDQKLLEAEYKSISSQIEESNKNIGNTFAKHWILFETGDLLSQGYEKLRTYQKWYQQNRNDNPTGLPYNIPDPKYLLEMLEQKQCYVCGEEFNDESEAYKHIQERYKKATDVMNRFKEKDKEELEIFGKVSELLSNNSAILSKIDDIQLNIMNHLKKMRD